MFGIPLPDFIAFVLALAVAGIVTGLLAGLFGVGGGAVIVPVLYQVFASLGVPEAVRMHLCVGTSLAIIIPTSIQSFRAHRAKGATRMDVLKLYPPLILEDAEIAIFAERMESALKQLS